MKEIERIHEAIRVFNQCKLVSDSFSQEAEKVTYFIALAALREKAEREKGCEYCKTDSDGYSTRLPKEINSTGLCLMEMFVPNSSSYGYFLIGGSRSHPIKTRIYACPMCGRALTGGNGNA